MFYFLQLLGIYQSNYPLLALLCYKIGTTGPVPPGGGQVGHAPPLSCEASSFRAAAKGERSLGPLLLLALAPPFQIRDAGPVQDKNFKLLYWIR